MPDNGTDPKASNNQTPDDGATDQKGSANHEENVVTLPKKDYDELISKRDANFEAAKKAEEKARTLEERVSDLEQSTRMSGELESFLSENADKYPDVDANDLSLARSPEDFEAIAKHVQAKAEAVREKEIENAQQPEDTSLSPSEYQKMEEELSEAAEEDPDAFGKMLQAQGRVDVNKK